MVQRGSEWLWSREAKEGRISTHEGNHALGLVAGHARKNENHQVEKKKKKRGESTKRDIAESCVHDALTDRGVGWFRFDFFTAAAASLIPPFNTLSQYPTHFA